jgi:hypothetical protein
MRYASTRAADQPLNTMTCPLYRQYCISSFPQDQLLVNVPSAVAARVGPWHGEVPPISVGYPLAKHTMQHARVSLETYWSFRHNDM